MSGLLGPGFVHALQAWGSLDTDFGHTKSPRLPAHLAAQRCPAHVDLSIHVRMLIHKYTLAISRHSRKQPENLYLLSSPSGKVGKEVVPAVGMSVLNSQLLWVGYQH